MSDETRTRTLAFAVEAIGAPSEDWLRRRLNAGQLPGIRIGRIWRMTDTDIAEAIQLMRRPVALPALALDATGLTPTSRRRLARRAAR